MRIAISNQENNINGLIDQRFGRCKYFIIVEVENNEIKTTNSVENQGALQGHGAGLKAAEQIGKLNVDAVITGDLGPNATNILKQLGIKAYRAGGKASEAINDYLKNNLKEINEIAAPHNTKSQIQNKSSEKIFFPLLDNNGDESKISEHFGHAPFFGLYNVEQKTLDITKNALDHTDPNQSPIDQIQKAVNPTTIFAKGIGGRAIDLIKEKGLELKTGDYSTVKEVIDNLDNLSSQDTSCGH
ncbi:MAG: hypothetical protein HON47_02915 [Candidatus Diapherotrites archaeon]|jgi:predicted Fe-Mo cluster-binding NifX family protein|uniref:Dinitrogenase iron-molybdenum cofactor biosynthesis domain-containing protein n=1 Tax=Candidatus Iainarchaeum sp. TaxID=3101447 RepID=A0A8T5GEW7_9ARCH|nr:hypothetical protein [Candidatus Diapherotrites archaeon]